MFTLSQKIEKLRGEPRHLTRENLGTMKAKMGGQLAALKSVNAGKSPRPQGVFGPKK
jgi:hypothetical protein